MRNTRLLFAVAVLSSLVFAPFAGAQTELAQGANLTAPAPAVMDSRPADSAPATTMPRAEGKLAVPAELISLPNELRGRWYTPGRQSSQVVTLKKVGGQWLLTWWKSNPTKGCSVEDAPVVVVFTNNGADLEIALNNKFGCFNKLSVKLHKNNNGEYEGEGNGDTVMGGGKVVLVLK